MDDPDTPSEVVGALTLPKIDLARLGLPPLGWLFVAGAAFVAVPRLGPLVVAPVEALAFHLLFAVAAVTISLLPAALLRRAPDAPRTHRLLLAGLAAGAVFELIVAVIGAMFPLGLEEGSWPRAVLDVVLPLLGPLGSVLVGLGLMRLRPGAHARFRLLAVIALAYVAFLLLVQTVIVLANSDSPGPIDGRSAVFLVAVPLTAAFAAWVPVSAWLERDPPRAFWGFLALVLPLTLATRALELPALIEVAAFRSNALFVVTTTLDALVAAGIALLAFVAYARLMPLATASE